MTYIMAVEIVPSDLQDTAHELHVDAIMIDSGSTLEVVFWGDSSSTTFVGMDPGTIYPFQVKYVLAAGTGASNCVGLRRGKYTT